MRSPIFDRISRPRDGFTIVELLVVISIIAMLVGLLLPAVNSARESSRRTQCTNNLYQLSMAMIQHGDSVRYIPGWRNVLPVASGTVFPSWPVPILPFMERTDIVTAWSSMTPQALATVAQPSIAFFSCPSSVAESRGAPDLAYAGNCGSGSTDGTVSAQLGNRFDGVMIDTFFARIGFDDIATADGTAMTALLGEKCGSPTAGSAFSQGYWDVRFGVTPPLTTTGSFVFGTNTTAPAVYDPTSSATSTFVPALGIAQLTFPGRVVNSGIVAAPGMLSQPSSNHPAGAVTAFCDGHTIFLNDTIAPAVYAQILSWNHLKASRVSRITWGANSKFPLSDDDVN